MLEVVQHDPESDTYFIASGFGEGSDWYRNLLATPRARIEVGRRKLWVEARRLERDEAERVMLDYGRRHRLAVRGVARVLGYHIDGTEEDLRELASILPLVALRANPS